MSVFPWEIIRKLIRALINPSMPVPYLPIHVPYTKMTLSTSKFEKLASWKWQNMWFSQIYRKFTQGTLQNNSLNKQFYQKTFWKFHTEIFFIIHLSEQHKRVKLLSRAIIDHVCFNNQDLLIYYCSYYYQYTSPKTQKRIWREVYPNLN